MSQRSYDHVDPDTGAKYPPMQTPTTRAHIQELVKKAQLMLAKDPDLMSDAKAYWTALTVAIDDKVSMTKPPMKNYEVHHLRETGRLWFLADIAEGHTPAQAAANGKKSLETGFK
jgi:hypothetical protein